MIVRGRIDAPDVTMDSGVEIGEQSIIRGDRVVLGKDVRIGDRVQIICDALELGSGCRIGSDTEILCPQVELSEGCFLGNSVQVELNEYFRLGQHSVIGNRFAASGQGLKSGEFLWMKDDIIVGGGGSKGPRSYLSIGNETTIIDKCFINISEEVCIGSNTALSYNVVLLTHGAWQPLLMGYPAKFASIHIGNYVVIYLNSVILPGVTIGDYSIIGANSLVLEDVPDHCLVVGNPAKIKRGPRGYPPPLNLKQIDPLIKEILADYLTTLPPKGVQVLEDRLSDECWAVISHENKQNIILYIPIDRSLHLKKQADITLAYGSASLELAGKCHFDLAEGKANGELTPIAEDLRDYLRRRAIRIMTGKPFRSLPLANLRRLKMMRQNKKP